MSCRAGSSLGGLRGAGIYSREWVGVGLERRHQCAEVKSLEHVEIWGTRGATVSVGNSGCRSHVLGIWRGCWGILCARVRPSQELWDGRSESMQQEQRRADGGEEG